MKKINYLFAIIFIALLFLPELTFAQGIDGAISKWSDQAKTVGRTVMGLAAIGGAVLVYFKMQNDDGSSGKKALMTYVGALIFAAVAWTIIETILPK